MRHLHLRENDLEIALLLKRAMMASPAPVPIAARKHCSFVVAVAFAVRGFAAPVAAAPVATESAREHTHHSLLSETRLVTQATNNLSEIDDSIPGYFRIPNLALVLLTFTGSFQHITDVIYYFVISVYFVALKIDNTLTKKCVSTMKIPKVQAKRRMECIRVLCLCSSSCPLKTFLLFSF